AAPLQHDQPPRLNRIQATSTRGVRARIRRVAGCATPTGSVGHAGATANPKLTFHLDHSAGADQGIVMDRRRFIRSVATVGRGAASPFSHPIAWADQAVAPPPKRFSQQLGTLDNIIRANGIDWDQPRSIYLSAPCGVEANADFAAIRARVQKMADIGPS